MPHFKAPDGASIYYEDTGTGTPLLCLSGLTRNARDFDFVAPHLPEVRMIRMDYRGRGLSEWTGPATYTVQTEAKDAVALLDHLGIARAAILGTSRGGLIALILAVTARNRLLGVAFNDVGPELSAEGLDNIAGYLGINPPFATLDAAAAARLPDPAFPGVPFDRWRQVMANTNVETAAGLVITYDPTLRDAVFGDTPQATPDLWPLFDALSDLPCAVIHGENSDLLSSAVVARMADHHPGLITAHVPDRGHIPFLDEEPSLAALSLWLEKLQ
ncbi:alpha/beta hydrolase [Pseudooceanicola sediminis]|uniref:Alpha/beta hydrolase n=1 Tax=Pseudooceanicola sediminis TaxID=2211117 RepID=A0A399IXZ2_9RHOB|nr:alpha/beta hydrolase [Pseudooceanicola sediminis]RII37975.1 alpha/beta hydrolase [Pseudooceanicola sediminis]|tara:strand:- start:13779 stop:14597 length:819 start_codon:yes stop_codon:yes gene_type:complete